MRLLMWMAMWMALLLSGCLPQPIVPPVPVQPIVDPTPQPVANAAWLFVLEESSERTPELAAMLADSWWLTLDGKGVKFRIYDQDADGAKDVRKIVDAKSVKLPAIVITDASGKARHVGSLPSSISGVKVLVGDAK